MQRSDYVVLTGASRRAYADWRRPARPAPHRCAHEGPKDSYDAGRSASTFNAREAPRDPQGLLALVRARFDPRFMPRIVGVSDTVTSHRRELDGEMQTLRGGNDRGFLRLVQEIGRDFEADKRSCAKGRPSSGRG